MLTMALAAYAAGASIPVLRNVIVLGLDSKQEQILREAIPNWIGQPLTEERLAAMERDLAGSGLPFDRLKLSMHPMDGKTDSSEPAGSNPPDTPRNMQLVFDFRPPPRVKEIRFFPLIDMDVARLRPACPIHAGDAYAPKAVGAALDALTSATRQAGFIRATVIPRPVPLTTSTLSLDFYIANPEPVKLRKAEFLGAGWFGGSRLRAQLKEMSLAMDNGSTVTASQLHEVEEASAAFMQAQGYIKAKARLIETALSDKGLRAVYQIERGERYRIASSRVASRRLPDPKFWEPATERFDDKHFTVGRIHDLEKAIQQQAQTKGYMTPAVKLDFVPSDTDHKVTVTADVALGTTSTLGAIRIERTPPEHGRGTSWYHRRFAPPAADELIRRQIRARMGAPLDRDVLDDAQRRLERLGSLDKVEVDTVPTSNALVRDLLVKFKEKRTARIGTSVGWSPEIGPITRLSLGESNLGGRGDGLALGASLDQSGPGAEITHLDRNWEPGERWVGAECEPSLTSTAYLSSRDYDEYMEQRTGGAVRLGYLADNGRSHWSKAWEARIERISYRPFDGKDEYEEDFNSYFAATLAHHLTLDLRDHPETENARGLLLDTAIEAGMADGLLLSWTTRMDYRRPLSKRWTWISQGEVGLMPVDATEVGLSHRYYIGGENGVRGFKYRGIGPVDAKNNDLHTGGATELILRNELQYRLNDSFKFPVFLDLGALGGGPLELGGPRASIGFGVHYTLPGDFKKEAYVYLSKNLMASGTDDQQTIRFGFNIPF